MTRHIKNGTMVWVPRDHGWMAAGHVREREAMNFAMQVAADPESELERLPNYLYPTESETET